MGGGGKIYFSQGETNARGVITLIRHNLDNQVEKVIKDNLDG